ncbi:hypothetical protein LXA43DRAFT_899590, partial [Ganoderma leucocontextum]
HTRQALVRPLEPEDWVALVKHAKFVRHIGTWEGSLWSIPDDIKLNDEFLGKLEDSASRPMVDLLPRLISFNWAGCRLPSSDLSRALCLLGIQVKTVRITEWPDGKAALIGALLLLNNYFPQLQEDHWFQYGFGFEPNSRPYLPYSPSTLPGAYKLRALTHLDCSAISITEATFLVLCQLPMLTSLSIHLPRSLAWTKTKNSSEVFQNLRDLTITSAYNDYRTFGAVIVLHQVEALHLRIVGMTRKLGTIPHIFSTITRQHSPAMLTTLSVCTSKSTLITGDAFRESKAWVLQDDVRQLFDFRNLVTLELGLICRYKLDGPLYIDIAKAWPRLEQLSIGNNIHRRPPTIQDALLPFVHCCPNLTRLEVTFDGQWPLEPEEVANILPHGRRSTSRVTSFSSIHSPIEEPDVIAAFLVRIFPELKDVHYDTSHMWSEYRWRAISNSLPWFSMIQNIGRA